MSDSGWLVVGLGNPGGLYARTRHNLGYRVADELAAQLSATWRVGGGRKAHVAHGRLDLPAQQRIVLAKPLTFMNESGQPVAAVAAYYKTPPERIIAVHDDLDLDLGAVRVKHGGGDGGHNGLRSLRRSLGSGYFFRVRLGIGRPPGRQDPADFVLGEFAASEREVVPTAITTAAQAVLDLVRQGLGPTQNRLHGH